jgi:hypothetical protein
MKGATAQLHFAFPRPPCENRADEARTSRKSPRSATAPAAGGAGTAARSTPAPVRPPAVSNLLGRRGLLSK